ncbi:MAG: hypothetical protein OXG18_11460 [Gemmatimonadetes bacterium]|nr:hypothetical protein [Gemmatimonadota bacterium]
MAELSAVSSFLVAAVGLAVPLALAALGETVTQRTGVINIGLEGSVIWGALGGALGALAAGSYAGLACGVSTGALAALCFALFAVRLGTNQIITGTAVTIGSLGFTGAVFQSRFGATGIALELPTVAALEVPLLSDIPILGPALFNQAAPAYVAYLLAPLLAWLLFRTRWGLALRAVRRAGRARRSAPEPRAHRDLRREHVGREGLHRDRGRRARAVESLGGRGRCALLRGRRGAPIRPPGVGLGAAVPPLPGAPLPAQPGRAGRVVRAGARSGGAGVAMAEGPRVILAASARGQPPAAGAALHPGWQDPFALLPTL